MPLILPNSIENDTPADAAELQQNFAHLQTYVNTNLVNRDGSVALTAPLLLPSDPTLPNQAANKGYVDGIDATKLNKSGDEAMTGPLIVQDIAKVGPRASFPTQALFTHKDAAAAIEAAGFSVTADGQIQLIGGVGKSITVYTSSAGPTYTSRLAVASTGAVTIPGELTVSDTIHANNYVSLQDSPTSADHATRKDYVDGGFVAKAGSTMSGNLLVFQDPDVGRGISAETSGRIHTNVILSGETNLTCERSSSGGAMNTGQPYIRFIRAGSVIGEIKIASGSTVAYDENSAARLKERVTDAADAADIVHDLGAKAYRGRWIADGDDGEEWVFLNSTDVEAATPFAVRGEMVDYSKLVPTLCAALSQALDRIEVLEAR